MNAKLNLFSRKLNRENFDEALEIRKSLKENKKF